MQARKLGPWSSAIQLVEARAAAAAAREDKILEAARGELEAQEAVAWAPARDVALGPRKACRVDPLFSLSLSLIVDYLEDVETLVGLPDAIKVRTFCQCPWHCNGHACQPLLQVGLPDAI